MYTLALELGWFGFLPRFQRYDLFHYSVSLGPLQLVFAPGLLNERFIQSDKLAGLLAAQIRRSTKTMQQARDALQ